MLCISKERHINPRFKLFKYHIPMKGKFISLLLNIVQATFLSLVGILGDRQKAYLFTDLLKSNTCCLQAMEMQIFKK